MQHINHVFHQMQNASSNLDKTIEIDGFLYDDDDVDDLVNERVISRYYCKDCDSNNVELYSKFVCVFF